MAFPARFRSCFSGRRGFDIAASRRVAGIPVSRPPARGGFSLIEVVAVLVIVAVLTGVFGTALTGNRETVALQAAQRNFAGLLTAARSQARMHSVPTRVVIDNDPQSDAYLRRAWIVREAGEFEVDGRNETNWESIGSGSRFRRGARLVPPDDGAPPEMFADYDDPGKRKSNGVRAEMFIDGEERSVVFFGFTSRGARSGINSTSRIVFAPARVTVDGPVFENSERALGMHLREYGTVTIVGDPTGFD